ncbi:MAG: hypothetical protein ACOX6Z_07610 [Dethiobacteria bacterium]
MEKYIKEGLLALLPCYREGAGGTAVFTLQGKYRDRRETTWLVKRLAAFYSIDLPALRSQCSRLLNLKRYVALPFADDVVLLPVKTRQAAQPGETTIGYLNLLQVAAVLPPAGVSSPAADMTGASLPGAGPPGDARAAGLPGALTPAGDERVADHRRAYVAKGGGGAPGVSWKEVGAAPAVPPAVVGEAGPAWLSRAQFKCGLQIKTLNTLETLHDRLRQGGTVLQHYRRRQKRSTVFTGFNSQELLERLPNCNCFLIDIFKSFLGCKNSRN